MSDIYSYRGKPASIPRTRVHHRKSHRSSPPHQSLSSTMRALVAGVITALLLSVVAYLTVRSVLGAGSVRQETSLIYDATK